MYGESLSVPGLKTFLRSFLKPDAPTAYMFSPKEAVEMVRAERQRKRKTPMTPSQQGRKFKARPKRAPGEQYSRLSANPAFIFPEFPRGGKSLSIILDR